eukprot:COSAG01_NODE_1458_length_10252_cov_247.726288_8_plen_107_part_00
MLLSSGGDVYATTDTGLHTPLHLAARGGRLDVCKVLLAHGANARALDCGGWSAVHLALQSPPDASTRRERQLIVAALVAAGANANDQYHLHAMSVVAIRPLGLWGD